MEMQRSYQKANRFFQVVPIIAALVICLFLTQAAPAATVNIDLNTTHQTIRGFGGMNFPRWGHGLQTDAQVDTAFGNGPGQIGLTIMRIDVPPDNNYNYAYGDYNWNLAVNAAKRAINNHGAIVFASPWTPPPSMKDNGSTSGTDANNKLSTGSYGAFATYLSNFANHFSTNGAPLYAISVQNEPDWLTTYESCGYSSTQMQTFLNNNASVIPTRMIAPETTGFNSSYMNTVASSSECDIVACHLYGGNGYYSYPGKEYWMTEHYTESAHDANVWPLALNVGKEIHDCMTNNMNAYVWWYIRRFYGPMGESGNITKRGYCMSHFAKFARPGYVRVDATANPQPNVYVTAYTYDCNLVIVAVNQNSSSQSVTFSLSGGSCSNYTKYETSSSNSLSNMGSVGSTDTLAANSINTYVGTVLFGDLNNDGRVDFKDFAILGQSWQAPDDMSILADIADNWLYGT
jgi:glucuronoarabinoxylan endo-1,4-beta-xylanase